MRLLKIPLPQLRALSRACPGLLQAIMAAVDEGQDPVVRVLRTTAAEENPRWYIEANTRILVLDRTDMEAMSAAVPIFLVDLVDDLRSELGQVFASGEMDKGIDVLIPFNGWFAGRGMPS